MCMSKKPENDNKCFVSNDVSLNLSPERKPVVAVLSSWLSKRYLVVIALLILLSLLYIVVFTLPKNVQLPQQVNTEDFIKEEDAKADALIKQINGEDAFLWRNF